MTNVPQEFWTWLSSLAELTALVKTRIHRNTVPQRGETPYLWFAQSGSLDDGCVDNAAGTEPALTTIDVECVGSDLDEASDVADVLKGKHLFRGTMGAIRVAGIFVEDAADDYQPRNDLGDGGRHIISLRVEIFR